MSAFIGRSPLPPPPGSTAVLAWDGTEFRPARAVSVNPVFEAIAATALALAIGTGISDANRIGLLPDTATAGSEALTLYVGGIAGPKWTRASAQVNLDLQGGTFKASSVTNTALAVSGGVVFASAVGLTQVSSGLTYSSNLLTVGDGSAGMLLALSGAAGTSRDFQIKSGNSIRWRWLTTSTAESGADAGSNFQLQAWGDGGSQIDTPITINRAAGNGIVCSRPLQPGSGSASAPSYSYSTETTTGRYRSSAGLEDFASAGVPVLRQGSQFIYSRNTSVALGSAPITNIQLFNIHGNDGSQSCYSVSAYGATPGFYSRRANGTAGALTALTLNDNLYTLFVQGYEGTTPGFGSQKGVHLVNAAEAWTSTAQGSYQDWYTTPVGSTTNTFRMRLMASGNLGLGTGTDGMTAGGSLAVAQDLAHRGTKAGFYNRAPVTQAAVPTIGAMTVTGTAGASYTATEQGMINALKADVATLRAGIIAVLNKLDQTAGTVGLLSGTAT